LAFASLHIAAVLAFGLTRAFPCFIGGFLRFLVWHEGNSCIYAATGTIYTDAVTMRSDCRGEFAALEGEA
jgi:hypothetical protein